VAVPAQVERVIAVARDNAPGIALRCHFHNTRNTGFANAWAAIQEGVYTLDASVGGIGGCPFAPRATGNIATEDLVYLLERSGIATGVDLDALLSVVGWMEDVLGRTTPGMLRKAGRFPR
jgi:hydroxymethylglutaryl-CoA lyase